MLFRPETLLKSKYYLVLLQRGNLNRYLIDNGTRILTWATVHGVPFHALTEGEGGNISIGVDTLPHITAPHALCTSTCTLATGGAQSTGSSALLHTVVGYINSERRMREKKDRTGMFLE